MLIYKIIARFGLNSELDSTIYCTYEAAMKNAYHWFNEEECDSVEIYSEVPDKETETFRTRALIQRLTKPF